MAALFFVLAIHVGTFPEPCSAQAHPSSGDRIRLKPSIEPRDRLTGTLISIASDTLALEADGTERAFSLADLDYVKVSTGKKSHLAGTIVGALVGAASGALIGSSIEQGLDDDCFDYCGLGGAYYGFIFGGIAGGVAGYLWLGEEQWADVSIKDLRVGIGADGFRLEYGL